MTDYDRVRARLAGPVVPLNVPYAADGAVDYDSARRYTRWLADNGVPIIMLTFGSTEYAYLTDAEIYELTRAVGEAIGGSPGTVFLAAADYWPVHEIIRYAEFARQCGADAVSVQPFWQPLLRDADVFAFYRAVGEATHFPLLAYTVGAPGMSPAVVARFAAELPEVIGMKNDSDQINGYFHYLRAAGDRVQIISGGLMRNMIFGYHFGSRAYLCPYAPFAPRIALEFYGCLQRGDYAAAAEFALNWEAPLFEATEHPMRWFSNIKTVIHLKGLFTTNAMRLPMSASTPSEVERLRAFLDSRGL